MISPQLALPLSESPEPAAPFSGGDVVWLYLVTALASAPVAGEFAALFGRAAPFDAEAHVGREWLAWIHEDDAARVAAAFDTKLAGGGYDETYRVVHPDGTLRWLRDRAYALGDERIVRVTSDLTAERELDFALAESRRLEATLSESAGTSLARVDELAAQLQAQTGARAQSDTRLGEIERAHRLVTGALADVVLRCDRTSRVLDVYGPLDQLPAAPVDLVGTRLSERADFPEAVRRIWLTTLERAFDTGRAQICAYALDVLAGPREFEARLTPVDGDEAIVLIREVSERNHLRERLYHVALHDTLTGLANVRALREGLAAWIAREPARLDRQVFALFLIDLDRFKQINDARGQAVGDSLLRLIAQRLSRCAGGATSGETADENADENADKALVARVGGDQFALALTFPDDVDAPAADAFAGALAKGMLTAIGEPTRLFGTTLFARASIGVALFPQDGHDPATLFSNAEAALMRAKQRGRNQYRLYGDHDADAGDRLPAAFPFSPPDGERALRAALAAGQISLLYQPKFELASSLEREAAEVTLGDDASERELAAGAVIGVEALVRWHVAGHGALAPAQFIPLAEKTGFIRPLGNWVLREALKQVGRFAELGAARVGVSVNVSVLELRDRDFVRDVEAALFTFGFAAHELTLEIAETAFVEDMRLVADTLAELSALGVNFAIDHFGTGTAGLVALKSLPIREIKIDRAFIAGCAIDAFDATIVSGLIEIAHDLGLSVTAEGVERADQIAFLSQVRCDAMQGYFVCSPMSAADLVRHTRLWHNTRAARVG